MDVTHFYIFSFVLKAIATKSLSESRFGAELNEPCSDLLSERNFVAMSLRRIIHICKFSRFSPLQYFAVFGPDLSRVCFAFACGGVCLWIRFDFAKMNFPARQNQIMRDANSEKVNISLTNFAVFSKMRATQIL